MELQETLVLVRRAQADDLQAREELFARYVPRVRVIVALKLGRRVAGIADEEDLVQDALLNALKGLDTFQPMSNGSFYDWITTIVANRIRDEWRRASTRTPRIVPAPDHGAADSSCLTAMFQPDPSPTPSEHAVGAEFGAQLETALLALEERQREAIVLRELCGLSYEELGKRFAVSESSARSIVTRSKAALAELLP